MTLSSKIINKQLLSESSHKDTETIAEMRRNTKASFHLPAGKTRTDVADEGMRNEILALVKPFWDYTPYMLQD